MADPGPPPELSAEQADATIRSKQYVGLLAVVAVIGVVVSIAAWCFLEAIYQIQRSFTSISRMRSAIKTARRNGEALPVVAVGALIVALAISRLTGDGGHIPARGLSAGGPSGPDIVPGVVLAGLATIGFGLVLGTKGPVDRVGRGARRGDSSASLAAITAPGADAGRGLRGLRRDVVHLRLPADRGGDPDRGDRDRRRQAPGPAGSRDCWPPESGRWCRSASGRCRD